MSIMEELKKHYVMKGVGTPQYYLGGDIVELGDEWAAEGIQTAFSAQTYISNCLPKLAKMLSIEQFPKSNCPMAEEYHPELDKSPLCPASDITKFKSLLGSANWIIILGRFDIQYAVNTLSRYSNAPREGHLKNLY